MRVLTYNIHKGFSAGDLRLTVHDIRESIRSTKADLVFLQEVVGENPEHKENHASWPVEAQFEFLADQMWSHFSYGKNAVYEVSGGRTRDHGNAILSRYPIQHWGNIKVSTNPMEQRGILYAAIQAPEWSTPVYCFCVHMDLSSTGRSYQLSRLKDRILGAVPADAPVLICGDMNDWFQQANSMLVEELGVKEVFESLTGRHARTFPSWLPLMHLDRIYFRSLTLNSASILKGPPWNRLSDHLALMADFRAP